MILIQASNRFSIFKHRKLLATGIEEEEPEAWSLSIDVLLLIIEPAPPPIFHLQSYSCSCGEAHDACVSSQLFIEQYHFIPFEPHTLPLEIRPNMCVGSTVRTIALHFPQLGLQQRIHSTSDRLFLPLVTADRDSLVSALSAVLSFLVHNFKNVFNGSSALSL